MRKTGVQNAAKINKQLVSANILKPTEAAALSYDPARDFAPSVVAAGRGFVADKIIETAKTAGVPVYRDKSLASALTGLRVGESIPRELYEVVAEVLAFVIGIDRDYNHSSDAEIIKDISND